MSQAKTEAPRCAPASQISEQFPSAQSWLRDVRQPVSLFREISQSVQGSAEEAMLGDAGVVWRLYCLSMRCKKTASGCNNAKSWDGAQQAVYSLV
jgi:hypothetical protein